MAETTLQDPGATSAPGPVTPSGGQRKTRRDLVAVNIGNAIEWFDWNVYAIFAPFFAAQIFRADDAISALLSTLAIFAVGFLMRPIGGWLFGIIGDRKGRKFSLTLAILLAAAGSLVIAITPTFDQVGVWAAVILLLARLVQGLSHGGETGAAFTYLAEIAPPHRRGLWASTPWLGVASGTMLATGLGVVLTSVLSDQQMADFGWRVPFVLGAVLGLYGLVLRFSMRESEVFEQDRAQENATPEPSTLRVLADNRKAVLRIAALATSGVVIFYTWFIFAPSYATTVYGVPANQALFAGLLAQAVFLLAVPFAGALSDRIGRKPMVILYTVGFIVLALPMEWIIGPSSVRVFLAMTIGSLILAVCCAPLGAIFTELVDTRVRATVVGITYGGFSAVFGGAAPYLNTWFTSQGQHWVFVVILMALCLMTLIVCRRMPETRGRKM